jgi:hypothetical protein
MAKFSSTQKLSAIVLLALVLMISAHLLMARF